MVAVLFFRAGGIPAPVYFGALIDSTCLKWSVKKCGGRGACRIYDSAMYRYLYTVDVETQLTAWFLDTTAIKLFLFWKNKLVCPSSGSSFWVWSPVSVVLPISSSLLSSLSWDGSFTSHSKTMTQKPQGKLSFRLHQRLLKTSPVPAEVPRLCLKLVLGPWPSKKM